MILVGDHTVAPFGMTGYTIYNLSSLMEGFERLDILPDQNMILTEDNGQQFDITYANFLLSNRMHEIMKVMCRVYNGENVFIMVYHDNGYFDMMLESVLKFIQSRYGIIPIMINSLEDYDNIEYNQYTTSLSMSGLYNYDIDNEAYTMYRISNYISTYGVDIVSSERKVDNNGDPVHIGQLY